MLNNRHLLHIGCLLLPYGSPYTLSLRAEGHLVQCQITLLCDLHTVRCMLFPILGFKDKVALLRCNSLTIQFIHFKYITQWFLIL